MNMWQTIGRCAGYQGMSDDQVANEREAQKILAGAIARFRTELARVNYHSAIVDIDLIAFDNFVHDELPQIYPWDESIAERRRG